MKRTLKRAVEVPNQVFIGCPWKTIRPKYEKVIASLKKAFPISFVIVGRDENQDAKELLEVIKRPSVSIFQAHYIYASSQVPFQVGLSSSCKRPILPLMPESTCWINASFTSTVEPSGITIGWWVAAALNNRSVSLNDCLYPV